MTIKLTGHRATVAPCLVFIGTHSTTTHATARRTMGRPSGLHGLVRRRWNGFKNTQCRGYMWSKTFQNYFSLRRRPPGI